MPEPSNADIIKLLQTAYARELETVQNYLANSVNLDGVRAQEIKKALAAEVTAELAHATQVAQRIKQIGGQVPGSLKLATVQRSAQPPADSTDVAAVIQGVLDAENDAIAIYSNIVRQTDGRDYVTQELAIQLLGQEEEHLTLFKGFLKEYRR
jgi:bacterioferritin